VSRGYRTHSPIEDLVDSRRVHIAHGAASILGSCAFQTWMNQLRAALPGCAIPVLLCI
jgi:hypothetical protein